VTSYGTIWRYVEFAEKLAMDEDRANRLAKSLPHIEVHHGSEFASTHDVIWYMRGARAEKRRHEEDVPSAGAAADTLHKRPTIRANKRKDVSALLELM